MKYKNKFICLLALGAGLLAASCSDDDDVNIPGGLAIDKEEITMGLAVVASNSLSLHHKTGWLASLSLG